MLEKFQIQGRWGNLRFQASKALKIMLPEKPKVKGKKMGIKEELCKSVGLMVHVMVDIGPGQIHIEFT